MNLRDFSGGLIIKMPVETPTCSICSSENATKASISKSDILFIGDHCLFNYLANISTHHTLISLTQLFAISSHLEANQGFTKPNKYLKLDFSLVAAYNLLQLSSRSKKLSQASNESRTKSIVYRDEFDNNLYRYDIATSTAEKLELRLYGRGILHTSTCQLPSG
jgi:hypothetical protein